MTRYRLQVVRNLFDTGARNPAELDYTKPDGSDWPISQLDYDLLNAVNGSCINRTFLADGDLDQRARDTALAAIQAELASRGEPSTGWDVIVNGSSPEADEWNPAVGGRWLHVTKTDGGVDGIAAAPYAGLDNGTVVATWRVPSIVAVEDAS